MLQGESSEEKQVYDMTLRDDIFNLLRRCGVATVLWHVLFRLGLEETRGGKRQTVNAERRKHARTFFSEHKEDIKAILKKLGDAESRKVYLGMLKYRQTSNMKDHPKWRFENQYFVKRIVPKNENEVFVDCGGYIGDTAGAFLKWSKGKFKSLVILEPDQNNFTALTEFIKKRGMRERTTLIRAGAWNREETLKFRSEADSSIIDPEGDVEIHAVALDQIPECNDATFIKMDIEGAEQKALEGAKDIIEKNHPKLAICIYHSDEDMVEIPKLIMEKYPSYNLYIRQHSPWHQETVLYAIPATTDDNRRRSKRR